MDKKNDLADFLNLLEKAANTTSEGITISTMTEEDRPLIYANEGFERLTGYSINEVVGKNCRFLQGEKTEEAAVDELRQAIKNGKGCTVELLNYKKEGTPFWNRLSISPLKNKKGEVTHYVGIQSDVTELKETKERLERANKDLEIFRDKITKELDQASKAQQIILPTKLPSNKHINFSAIYKPMAQIGGDFYDIIELRKGLFGILIADVTGYGIPAALLTFMTSLAFQNSVRNVDSSELLISLTNDKLIDKMPKGAFITMFYAIYDSNSKILTYTQAGHPPGFIVRSVTKEVIPLSTDGGIVGVFGEDKITYHENKAQLQTGDKFILYTDALIEARDQNNQMIGIGHLGDFLLDNCAVPIAGLLEMMYQFGLDFSGNSSYEDDLTLVGFEVLS